MMPFHQSFFLHLAANFQNPAAFINLPSLVERTLWAGFFLFTLILIVGVLTCRNLQLQRIALSVFLEAYLFLLFLFVFAWPKSQVAQHTFGTDRAVRRLPPQKIMSFGEL